VVLDAQSGFQAQSAGFENELRVLPAQFFSVQKVKSWVIGRDCRLDARSAEGATAPETLRQKDRSPQ
jgi:hypothetical protein